jgi:hypothetical protein
MWCSKFSLKIGVAVVADEKRDVLLRPSRRDGPRERRDGSEMGNTICLLEMQRQKAGRESVVSRQRSAASGGD